MDTHFKNLHETKFVLLQILAELGLTHTSTIEMAAAGKPYIYIYVALFVGNICGSYICVYIHNNLVSHSL